MMKVDVQYAITVCTPNRIINSSLKPFILILAIIFDQNISTINSISELSFEGFQLERIWTITPFILVIIHSVFGNRIINTVCTYIQERTLITHSLTSIYRTVHRRIYISLLMEWVSGGVCIFPYLHSTEVSRCTQKLPKIRTQFLECASSRRPLV